MCECLEFYFLYSPRTYVSRALYVLLFWVWDKNMNMNTNSAIGRTRLLRLPYPTTDIPGLLAIPLIKTRDLVTTLRLTCSLVPSHEHVSAHHTAHAQDADHDADEMHSLVPDQQEEPGEQNHHRDHKAVQELLGASGETTARGSGMLGHKKSSTLSESPSQNKIFT